MKKTGNKSLMPLTKWLQIMILMAMDLTSRNCIRLVEEIWMIFDLNKSILKIIYLNYSKY